MAAIAAFVSHNRRKKINRIETGKKEQEEYLCVASYIYIGLVPNKIVHMDKIMCLLTGIQSPILHTKSYRCRLFFMEKQREKKHVKRFVVQLFVCLCVVCVCA